MRSRYRILERDYSHFITGTTQLRNQRASHRTESQHQVWQEGFHPQAIVSDPIMLQKLEYLHNNPVKRGLVASAEHWRYSSAHEWLPGAVIALRTPPPSLYRPVPPVPFPNLPRHRRGLSW